jgi:hypothetical protein
VEQPAVVPPGAAELQAYSLGKCDRHRAAEIEAFLTGGPDCHSILEAAADDDLVRHLRGAGKLPALDRPGRPPPPTPGPAEAADTDPDGGADAAALRDHPRYRLIRKLGQGGMGAVYLAEHRLMRRLVALKVLRAGCLGSPRHVARFRQEVEAAARLSHPHIVTAHDADEAGGTHFLVMEYVEGQSLDRRAAGGPLPVHEACACARQAALGLDFAHRQGMVHRDVKPANLMRAADGTVKVLDFGLARLLRETTPPEDQLSAEGALPGPGGRGPLTSDAAVMGTADYMAPEQARDSRAADTRADVYSLGCTLYHLLAGHVPFPGGTAADKIGRHAAAAPEPLRPRRAGVPAGLAAVVGRMMAKRPEDRYQSPGEVAAALTPYCRPRRRGRLRAAVLAAALLVGGGVVAAAVSRTGAGAVEPEGGAPGPARMEVVRRIPVAAAGDRFYEAAVSAGGKYALVTGDHSGGPRLAVFNVATGEQVFTCPGSTAQFLNADQLVVDAAGWFRVFEAGAGKLLREGRHRPLWGMIVAPGGRHLVYNGPGGVFLYDLLGMRELHAWEGKAGGNSTLLFSPDGKRLVYGFEGDPWRGWDVERNCPGEDLGGLRGVTRVLCLYPDNRTAAVAGPGPPTRIDLATGKAVEAFPGFYRVPGVVQSRFSRSWRHYLVRLGNGGLLVYRLPPQGRELCRFQLPPDDCDVWPERGSCRWEALSEDDRYAALLTTRSLYVLRLPGPPAEDRP